MGVEGAWEILLEILLEFYLFFIFIYAWEAGQPRELVTITEELDGGRSVRVSHLGGNL